MPITAEWGNNEKTIAYWDFEGVWTWDEFRSTQAQSIAMMRTVDHPVDVIANMERCQLFPQNAIMNYRVTELISAPNRGRTVIVGGNVFIKALVATYNRIFKNPHNSLLLADSDEEARALLAKFRESSRVADQV
jgi:hypothetical protein